MNASPAMDTGGPLLVPRRAGRAALARRARATLADRGAVERPGRDRRRARRAVRRDRVPLPAPSAPAAPTCASSTAARWRSPSSAPPRASRSARRRASTDAGSRSRPSRRRSAAARRRARADRRRADRGRARRRRRGGERRRAPDQRHPRQRRYRRHTVGVMARRAVEFALRRARGEEVAIPCNRDHRDGGTPHEASRRDHAQRQRHRLPGRDRAAPARSSPCCAATSA